MTVRLSQRICNRRASDRLAMLNMWFGVPQTPKAPAFQSPDCSPSPGEAGASISACGSSVPPNADELATGLRRAPGKVDDAIDSTGARLQ